MDIKEEESHFEDFSSENAISKVKFVTSMSNCHTDIKTESEEVNNSLDQRELSAEDSKIEIKEEQWWLETSSTETPFSFVDIKGGPEDFHSVESPSTFQLMRGYCEEAFKYGTVPLSANSRCRQVTVILNPAANRRKAKKDFEKFCAPLLHLAGIIVNVVQTEYEGQARSIMETSELSADAVVIAGGDGTLSEAITGLLRRPEADPVFQRLLPLGVLPLGRTNTVAWSLFGDADAVKMMADATMSVIREVTKPVDVMKVQVIDDEGESKPPVYCVAGVEWGAYRDALSKREKYWYWGALRSYAAFVFMGLKGNEHVTWECNGQLQYILPCSGCSKCYVTPHIHQTRWWHAFIPRQSTHTVQQDYSKIVNEECGKQFEEEISTVELQVASVKSEQGTSHMQVSIGPKAVNYTDFVTEGWRRLGNNEHHREKTLHIREMKLKPTLLEKQTAPKWISIDNEDYELKPLHIKLLRNKVNFFCTQ